MESKNNRVSYECSDIDEKYENSILEENMKYIYNEIKMFNDHILQQSLTTNEKQYKLNKIIYEKRIVGVNHVQYLIDELNEFFDKLDGNVKYDYEKHTYTKWVDASEYNRIAYETNNKMTYDQIREDEINKKSVLKKSIKNEIDHIIEETLDRIKPLDKNEPKIEQVGPSKQKQEDWRDAWYSRYDKE